MNDETPLLRLVNDSFEALSRDVGNEDRLKSGDGGGTSGGMEARIARLESDMDHVKKAVDKLDRGQEVMRQSIEGVRVNFAAFDERSKSFPTKGFIFATAAGLLAAAGGIMAIVVRFIPHV